MVPPLMLTSFFESSFIAYPFPEFFMFPPSTTRTRCVLDGSYTSLSSCIVDTSLPLPVTVPDLIHTVPSTLCIVLPFELTLPPSILTAV